MLGVVSPRDRDRRMGWLWKLNRKGAGSDSQVRRARWGAGSGPSPSPGPSPGPGQAARAHLPPSRDSPLWGIFYRNGKVWVPPRGSRRAAPHRAGVGGRRQRSAATPAANAPRVPRVQSWKGAGWCWLVLDEIVYYESDKFFRLNQAKGTVPLVGMQARRPSRSPRPTPCSLPVLARSVSQVPGVCECVERLHGVARPRLLLAACVRCAPNIALYTAAWLQMRADVEQQQREHCFALVSLSGELWLAAESAAEKEQWVAIGEQKLALRQSTM